MDKSGYEAELKKRKNSFQNSIVVCDDSEVVIIHTDWITEEFYQKLIDIEEQEDIWYDCIDRRKWSTYKTICLKDYVRE